MSQGDSLSSLHWQSFFLEDTLDKKNIPILELLTQQQQVALVLFNMCNRQIEYLSPNAFSMIGCHTRLSYEESYAHFYNTVLPEHLSFSPIMLNIIQILREQGIETGIEQHICGLKYQLTEGVIRLAVRAISLPSANQCPMRALYIVQNITHLLKGDFYWLRICADARKIIFSYHSQMKHYCNTDIISKREMDILRLIVQRKTTAEIAKQFFLSENTVNNHRQRMLNKLGAKDTTALIQISQMFDLVL